jgi:hypothetical protein
MWVEKVSIVTCAMDLIKNDAVWTKRTYKVGVEIETGFPSHSTKIPLETVMEVQKCRMGKFFLKRNIDIVLQSMSLEIICYCPGFEQLSWPDPDLKRFKATIIFIIFIEINS